MRRRGSPLSRKAQGTPSSWTRVARNSGTSTNHSNGDDTCARVERSCQWRNGVVMVSCCSVQRTSYLAQHRGGHSGDVVHGRPAVLLRAGEGGLVPGLLVAQARPALAAGAEGGGAAPAPPAGRRESHGQSGQQQGGLGQSGAAQSSHPEPREQPRDGLPVLRALHVPTPAPLQEAGPQPSARQQSGHQRFGFHSFLQAVSIVAINA